MKRILGYPILILLICLITSIALGINIPLKASNLMETKMGGIKLYEKKGNVYQRLGKPIKSSYDKTTDSTDIYYRGIKVELDSNGYVIHIESTSSKYPINRGIKIGDMKTKIIKKYGFPSLENKDKKQNYLQYNSTKYKGWGYCLRFYISKEKVVKISIFDPWGNGL